MSWQSSITQTSTMSAFNPPVRPQAGPSGTQAGGETGVQAAFSSTSNAEALSALHTPLDFGQGAAPFPTMQQQMYGGMATGPGHTPISGVVATEVKPTASKQTKPRKRKTTDGSAEDGGTPSSRGGGAGSGRGSRGGRGGRGGGAGAGGGTGRKLSKTQAQMQDVMATSSPTAGFASPYDGSGEVSRADSAAPSTPVTGPSTPTKRGGRGGGGRGSRGGAGRGGGRGRGGRGRAGSRQTSARRTASVAPGATMDDSGTAAPLDGPGGGGEEEGDVDEEGGEEEEEESEEENADQGLEEDELDRQEAIQRQRAINMGPLMKAMTEEQLDRYSAFRRSYLDKRFVRRLIGHLTRQMVTPQVTTLVAGVGKVFIGEIVERARQVRQEREGNSSDGRPLQPEHLIEALRRYREEREVPGRFSLSAPNFNTGLGGNGRRRGLF